MAQAKIAPIKLEDIKSIFFVRRQLNRQLVETLAAAYEAGENIPPIKVNPDNVLIDGRHRVEAAKSIGKETVQAEITPVKDDTEMYKMAVEANGNGPMPLLKQDYGHIVSRMVDKGMSVTRIQREIFPKVPISMLRKLATDSLHTRDALRWKQLRAKVVEGKEISAAAIEVGLSPEAAVEALGGIKRSLLGTLGNVPHLYSALSGQVSKTLNEWLDEYQAGKITGEELQQVIAKCFRGANQHLNNLRDWERRIMFATSSSNQPETTELAVKEKSA